MASDFAAPSVSFAASFSVCCAAGELALILIPCGSAQAREESIMTMLSKTMAIFFFSVLRPFRCNFFYVFQQPGLPSMRNIFFLYASTPGWLKGLTPDM